MTAGGTDTIAQKFPKNQFGAFKRRAAGFLPAAQIVPDITNARTSGD